MFFKNSLEKKLKQWGKDVHASPPSVMAMKGKVLDLVKVPNKTVSRLQSPRPYFFAFSGIAAVLVLFVGVHLYKSRAQVKTFSSSEVYDVSPQAMSVGGGGCGAGMQCDLSASVGSDELGAMYGQETGLGDSCSVLASAVDVVKKVSNEAASLVAPTASVPDTREFFKYEYNASIKSRHVQELTGRLQTVVRGYGGRVDSVSVQKKYGYIYFVVPKSSLDDFKSEVKSLANARFYEESVQGQNLLPEKVVIEKSLDTTNQSLVSWQESLSVLDKELQDTVETVQGSIQLQWVSIFEVINIYVPYFWLWIIIIFVLIMLIRHYTKRRSFEVV